MSTSEIGNDGKGMEIENSFISPWALPNEGMTLYLMWNGFEDFDFIQINIPDIIEIREYLNVNKSYPDPKKIMKEELSTCDYLGLILSPSLIDEIERDIEIILEFVKNEEIVFTHSFNARIIRPKIEIDVPEKINVISKGVSFEVEIGMRYTGYGTVYGKIGISNKKECLEFDVKSVQDYFMLLANSSKFKEFASKHNILDEEELLEIPDDQYEYMDYLLSELRFEKYTPDDFVDALQFMAENIKFKEIIEEKIQQPKDTTHDFVESILNFIEKRPVEDVYIANEGAKSMEVKVGDKLYVQTGYIDGIGNYYEETAEILIDVENKNILSFEHEWEEKPGDWEWLKQKKPES